MRDKRVLIGDYTRKEFRERVADGTFQAAIVPTAATEQHLEHLEMTHDTASCTLVALEVARTLHPQVVVSPTVAVGVSEHHLAHKGSLTVRVGIFLEYVFDICDSISRGGIKNILILNGHGGNMHCLSQEQVRFRQHTGANIVYASYWDVFTEEEAFGLMESRSLPGHANEFETSFALAAFPERVHSEDMDDEDAKLGTTEKGEKSIEIAVRGVSNLIERMIAGETPPIEPHSFRPDGVKIGGHNFPYQAPRIET